MVRMRILALLSGATLMVAPAAAPVPDDVAAFFAESAPDALDGEDLVGDPPIIHEVFTWSPEFLAGDQEASATVSLQEWIAPLERAGTPTGTLSAYRASPSEPATLATTGANAGLSQALLLLPDDARLVHDGPQGAWFSITDDTVAALDDRGLDVLPRPLAIGAFQPQLVERYAALREQSAPAFELEDQLWLIAAGTVALVFALLATIGAVRMRRRRRR